MRKGIKEKNIRDFEKYARKLNDLMYRIHEYNPNVNIYLAMESLNLMNGPHHDDYFRPLRENVVTDVDILYADGGDW